MRLALIQQSNSSDLQQNLEKTLASVRQAAAEGAQVICLQELFNTLYFCIDYDESAFAQAESMEGPTLQRLRQEAASLGVVLVVPFFEKRAPGCITTARLYMMLTVRWPVFIEKCTSPTIPVFARNTTLPPVIRAIR